MSNVIYLSAATGAPVYPGNIAPRLHFRVGGTFELSVVFLDDFGQVTSLSAGALGSMLIKPLGEYLADPLYVATWQPAGTGSTQRYVFSAALDSQPLRDQFVGSTTSVSMAMQITWSIGAALFAAESLTCTLEPSYYAPGDLPPPLLGSTEREDWNQTILNPDQEWLDVDTYAGNVTTGGSITALRLSVAEYHPGGQIKLFADSVLLLDWTDITAQTALVELTELELQSLATGARLDVQTRWLSGTEYALRAKGLELGLTLRARAVSLDESWDWLKARIPTSSSVSHNNTLQTIAITGGSGGSLPSGLAKVSNSSDGLYVEFRDATTDVLIARVLRAE